jgi:hypothetical protein
MTTDYRRLATVIALTKRKLGQHLVGRPDDAPRPPATSPRRRP